MVQSANGISSEDPVDVNNSVQKANVSGNDIDIEEIKTQTIMIGTTSSPNEGTSTESQRRIVNNSQQHLEVTSNKISIKGSTAEAVTIGIIGATKNQK